jgi:hypothetical protein
MINITITFFELERLRLDVHIRQENAAAWAVLLQIGRDHLTERGAELIRCIKLVRKMSNEDIENSCELRKGTIEKILESGKSSRDVKKKLGNVFGYKF